MMTLPLPSPGDGWRDRKTRVLATVSDVWRKAGFLHIRVVFPSGMATEYVEPDFLSLFDPVIVPTEDVDQNAPPADPPAETKELERW